ncbi:MAG: cytochrome c biogenesis protein CcdA [Verrucomicrobiota bacterium]
MKALLLTFLVCGAALADSPFGVTPKLDGQQLRVTFTMPAEHHIYADRLSFELDGTSAAFLLPVPADVPDKFSGEINKSYVGTFAATYTVPATAKTLTVRLQGCDDARCYFPEVRTFPLNGAAATQLTAAVTPPAAWRDLADRFTVTARGSGYLNEKDFLAFLNKTATPVAGLGLVATLGLILLGGIGLNLTPCILPLIPINLAIIGAGAQAGSKRRGFFLGAVYATGMAVAYGLLGVIVVLTGAKFGTLNSSPWFNLAIAGVFVVLALAMFDVFTIDLSRFQGGAATEGRSKFVVAYTMGSVAALLAGACVAPVVISVLLQATNLYNRGLAIGLALPFLLGLGMGIPWPFAGAGLSFLPKPGKWMMRVKYGFGVMIAGMALYYGWLTYGLLKPAGPIAGDPLQQLAATLARADKEGKPVFVDFYASWCKNCSAMEHTTFRSAAVKQQLSEYVQIKLPAEHPNEAPAKEILDYFGALGLPTYVVLTPKEKSTKVAMR